MLSLRLTQSKPWNRGPPLTLDQHLMQGLLSPVSHCCPVTLSILFGIMAVLKIHPSGMRLLLVCIYTMEDQCSKFISRF